jgi:hypothetical protein
MWIGNRRNQDETPLEGAVGPRLERAAALPGQTRSLISEGQRLDGGQADAALLATACENLAAAAGRHAGAESKLADALDLRGLPKLLHGAFSPKK